MKNTGIVRQVDCLGRIVIPKEIRKVNNINDGDLLEIHVTSGYICLKKYEAKNEIQGYIDDLKNKVNNDYSGKKDILSLINSQISELENVLKEFEVKK